MRKFKLITTVPLAALCVTAAAQIPEGYEVVTLANDLGIHSRPDINDRSEVVWSSSFPFDESDIWLFSDGVITKISDPEWYDVDPAINDNGLIVWRRCEDYFDFDCDLVAYQNGVIQVIPTPVSIDQTAAVNNAGEIVFAHDFSGTFDHVELFRVSREMTEQITFSGLANQTPRINAQGAVVWIEYDFGVAPWTSTVKMLASGDDVPLCITDGNANPQGADVSDSPTVVWGEVSETSHVIKKWTGGEVSTIAFGTVPRINGTGSVSFSQWDEAQEFRHQMLLTAGSEYQLPSRTNWWAAKSDINDQGEVAWREINPDTGDTRIVELRRVGPQGDADHDCRIDQYDFKVLQVCFTGQNSGPEGGFLADCVGFDSDQDGDIDAQDFEAFLNAYTGADGLVPGCVP